MWTERKVRLRELIQFPSRLSLPPEGSVEQQEKEVGQCTALVPAAPVFWLAMAGNWSRIRAGGRKETPESSLLQCALTHPVKPGSLACFRASWRARSVTSLTLHRR